MKVNIIIKGTKIELCYLGSVITEKRSDEKIRCRIGMVKRMFRESKIILSSSTGVVTVIQLMKALNVSGVLFYVEVSLGC